VQESGASEVVAQFHIGRMSCAVDLDDEPLLSTRKVGKVRADRFLTDEFEPLKAAASQRAPQLRFGSCLISAQRPRPARLRNSASAHRPLTLPYPRKRGEGFALPGHDAFRAAASFLLGLRTHPINSERYNSHLRARRQPDEEHDAAGCLNPLIHNRRASREADEDFLI